MDKSDQDVTCTKVYYPQDGTIHVHQSRVSCCPAQFPAGFYWYGGKRKGPGRPPKWVERLLESGRTSGLPLDDNDLSRVSGDTCPSSCDSGDPPVSSTNAPDHVADSGNSLVCSRDDPDHVLEQTFHEVMTGSEQVSSESHEEKNTSGGGAVAPALNDHDATRKGEGCGSGDGYGDGSELFGEAIPKKQDSQRL